MKIADLLKAKKKPIKTRIPEVGDLWYHSSNPDDIYMRVADSIGMKYLGYSEKTVKESFFSIEINGQNIWHTPLTSKDIVIVE